MEDEDIPKLVFGPPTEQTCRANSSKSLRTQAINVIAPTEDEIHKDELNKSEHRMNVVEEKSIGENKIHEATSLREQMEDCLLNNNMKEFGVLLEEFKKLKSEGIIDGLADIKMVDNNCITLLQKSIVYERNEVTQTFLQHCDKKVLMHRNLGMCEGNSILHDAVVKNRKDVIKILAEKLSPDDMKILFSYQAVGSFFKDAFQGHELPLFIAVWIQNLDMIRFLLNLCPDAIYMLDSNSGNFLHCLVRISQEGCPIFAEKVFRMVWESEGGKVAIEHLMMGKCSGFGQTPMQFALRRGEFKFVQLLLSVPLKKEVFRYGPATFTEYDITDLETSPEAPSGGLPGVMLVGTSSNLDSLPHMLNTEPWKKILELRWDYYKYTILVFFLVKFIMLITMATCLTLLPTRAEQLATLGNYIATHNSTSVTFLHNAGYFGNQGIVIFTLQCIFILYGVYNVIGIIIYLTTQIIAMKKPKLTWSEINQRLNNPVTGNGIYIILGLVFGVSIILGNVAIFFKVPEADIAITVQVISGFCLLTFYYRCLDYTSFFTVTVNKMLYGDVIRFIVIAVGYLLGFGVGFYVMFKNQEGGPPKDVENFYETIVTTYKLMIGQSDFSTLRVQFETVLVIIYVIYSILMTIMLFNLLIGIMANTINDVADQKDYLGELQRLSTVIYIESQVAGLRKPFATRCVENGHMKIKTVEIAGKSVKRLFIECIEVADMKTKQEDIRKEKFITLKNVN